MKTFRIKTTDTQESTVIFRRQVLKTELAQMKDTFMENGCILFTDETVERLYGKTVKKYLGGIPVHVMPAGEAYKNEKTLFELLAAMSGAGLRRGSALIVLGGGVVGDVGGLAASLYMRGIDCIQIPTTLLSQVDSAIGGKTAIDFEGVKNLIGAFCPPKRTYVDPVFLETLQPREMRSGLGEIVKHGALHRPIYEKLLENRENLFDLNFLSELIPENLAFKASVVRQDVRDKDVRKCLNLGHTTAHALELSGLALSHGECVLVGLMIESAIAQRRFECDGEFHQNLKQLARAALGGQEVLFSPKRAAAAAMMDKKNEAGGKIVLTVPTAPGKYELLALSKNEYIEELYRAGEKLC